MTSHRLRALVFGPPAVLIVYGLTAAEGRWPRSPFARLSRIGDASYSLYLFHPTALVAAKWAGVLVPHTRLGHLLWLAFAFALAIAFGFAMHAWIEKPLLKLGTLRWPSHRASLAKLARWPAAALRGRTIPLPRTP